MRLDGCPGNSRKRGKIKRGLREDARKGSNMSMESMERQVGGSQMREKYVGMRLCFKLRAEQMCKLRKRIG